MDLIRSFFDASPIAVLFVCVAIGFAIGRIKVAGGPIGGVPGTLFAAIVIGQVGVEVDENIKTMAFALFIYSLGYVSGPSFFQSLGRSTLNLVNLSLVSSVLIFVTIWGLAQIFGLDKGTAAGLLAGGITESAAPSARRPRRWAASTCRRTRSARCRQTSGWPTRSPTSSGSRWWCSSSASSRRG